MSLNKLLTLAVCAFSCMSAVGEEKQFICIFGAEVKLTELVPDNPMPKVTKSTTKFTFVVSDNSSTGKYVNLGHGIVSPILYYTNGQTATFIEKNSSDNLFVVTAFLDQNTALIPAVFTQYSWLKRVQSYGPYMALGNCSISRL